MARGRKTGGRDFQRGQPPPPGSGRKRLDPLVRETFKQLMCRKFGPNSEWLIERAFQIASGRAESAKDRAVVLQAVGLLLGYSEGKPLQRTEISGAGGVLGLDLRSMSTAALQAHVVGLLARWPAASLAPGVAALLPAGSASTAGETPAMTQPEGDNVVDVRRIGADGEAGGSGPPHGAEVRRQPRGGN